MYLIWSFEHNGWWAPNRNGYVPDVARAGGYDDDDAHEIVAGANIGTINEALVPITVGMGDTLHPAHRQP